jgi:hypothetical protein
MGITDWISGLFKPASDAYAAKVAADAQKAATQAQVTEQAQTQATEVQLENIKADEQWEAAAQAKSGWKDELWTLGFFGVFVGSFIPGLQQYVAIGIQQLTTYPYWFMLLFSSAVMASFGIRFWRRK